MKKEKLSNYLKESLCFLAELFIPIGAMKNKMHNKNVKYAPKVNQEIKGSETLICDLGRLKINVPDPLISELAPLSAALG